MSILAGRWWWAWRRWRSRWRAPVHSPRIVTSQDRYGNDSSHERRYDDRYDSRYDDRGGDYDYAKVVDVQPLTPPRPGDHART